METTIVYWVYIGVMEKKMESTIVCCGYIGRVEKKTETTILQVSAVGSSLSLDCANVVQPPRW